MFYWWTLAFLLLLILRVANCAPINSQNDFGMTQFQIWNVSLLDELKKPEALTSAIPVTLATPVARLTIEPGLKMRNCKFYISNTLPLAAKTLEDVTEWRDIPIDPSKHCLDEQCVSVMIELPEIEEDWFEYLTFLKVTSDKLDSNPFSIVFNIIYDPLGMNSNYHTKKIPFTHELLENSLKSNLSAFVPQGFSNFTFTTPQDFFTHLVINQETMDTEAAIIPVLRFEKVKEGSVDYRFKMFFKPNEADQDKNFIFQAYLLDMQYTFHSGSPLFQYVSKYEERVSEPSPNLRYFKLPKRINQKVKVPLIWILCKKSSDDPSDERATLANFFANIEVTEWNGYDHRTLAGISNYFPFSARDNVFEPERTSPEVYLESFLKNGETVPLPILGESSVRKFTIEKVSLRSPLRFELHLKQEFEMDALFSGVWVFQGGRKSGKRSNLYQCEDRHCLYYEFDIDDLTDYNNFDNKLEYHEFVIYFMLSDGLRQVSWSVPVFIKVISSRLSELW